MNRTPLLLLPVLLALGACGGHKPVSSEPSAAVIDCQNSAFELGRTISDQEFSSNDAVRALGHETEAKLRGGLAKQGLRSVGNLGGVLAARCTK